MFMITDAAFECTYSLTHVKYTGNFSTFEARESPAHSVSATWTHDQSIIVNPRTGFAVVSSTRLCTWWWLGNEKPVAGDTGSDHTVDWPWMVGKNGPEARCIHTLLR